MAGRLPIYKLTLDDSVEGMDYMGLVDTPAHGKSFIAFNKLPKSSEIKSHFNEEKRIVTGVAIATNLQIYRRTEEGYEYNAVFTKEDTKKIAIKLAENGYMNNVNEMHDLNRDVVGMSLFESYFIEDDKRNIPDCFLDQNLQPGSWIVSYKINNDKVWKKIKQGEFYGFSIEGWFKEIEMNIKKSKNEKMKRKSILEKLGYSKKEESLKFDKDKHGQATTVDGITIMWEGDMPMEGMPLFIVDNANPDEMILASDGEYSFEVDGVMMLAVVDESGMIMSLSEVEAMEDEEEEDDNVEAMKALQDDFNKKFEDQKKSFDDKLKEIAKELDNLANALDNSEDKEDTNKKRHSKSKRNWRRG